MNWSLYYMKKCWRVVSVFRFDDLIDDNPGVGVLQMVGRPHIHPEVRFGYVTVENVGRKLEVLTLDFWWDMEIARSYSDSRE